MHEYARIRRNTCINMHKYALWVSRRHPGGTPRHALVHQWGPRVILSRFWVIFEALRRPLWDPVVTSFQPQLDPAGQRRAEETPKVVTARKIEFQMASQRASLSPQTFILC